MSLWQTLASKATDMANRTNISVLYTSYEYYLDYVDLIPVDEKKLKANKRKFEPGKAARQRLRPSPDEVLLALTSLTNSRRLTQR